MSTHVPKLKLGGSGHQRFPLVATAVFQRVESIDEPLKSSLKAGDTVAEVLFPAVASLALVWAKDLRWRIPRTGEYQRRRTRVRFPVSSRDGAAEYDIALTDPIWEHRLSSLPVGEHPQDAAPDLSAEDRILLTVSLSEPLGDNPVQNETGTCYKLAAAVIVVPPEWRGTG